MYTDITNRKGNFSPLAIKRIPWGLGHWNGGADIISFFLPK